MIIKKLADSQHHIKWIIAAMIVSQLLLVIGVGILIWLYLHGRLQ